MIPLLEREVARGRLIGAICQVPYHSQCGKLFSRQEEAGWRGDEIC